MRQFMLAMIALTVIAAAAVATGTQEAVSQAGEEVPVITWVNQNDGPTNPDSPVTLRLEEMFGIDIEYIYLERNNLQQLLNLRVASGEIPDVMMSPLTQQTQFARDGVTRRLDMDIMRETAPEFYRYNVENLGESVFDWFDVDGEDYILPMATPGGNYHFTPTWRGDWLEEVGIDEVPETLEEAEEAWYAFANEDPDGNGIDDTYAMSEFGMYAVFGAYGANASRDFYWSVRDGEIIASAVIPRMQEALALLHQYYADGLIDPEFITGENKGQYWANSPAFWNGIIGFSVPGTYYHVAPAGLWNDGGGNWRNFKEIQGDDGEMAYGPPLVGPYGEQGILHWSTVTGNGISFGRDMTDLELQKYFEIVERYTVDPDFYVFTRFGIEGEHFEYVDGIPQMNPDIEPGWPARLGLVTNGVLGSQPNFDMMYETLFNEARREFSREVAQVTPGRWQNALVGVLPSQGEYLNELESMRTENYYAFITGDRPLDEWDEFVDEMMSAGLDILTREANEWYSRFGG